MKITVKQITDKLAWVLAAALLASFVVFSTEYWGRYIYIGLAGAVLLLTTFGNRGHLVLRVKPFHVWAIAFALFAFVSSLWAVYSGSRSVANGTTLILNFVCAAMVYVHYQEKEDCHSFLTAVMWAGYATAIYTLVYYGYDQLEQMAMESAERMENEYANVNSIGMMAALACVLQVNELYNRRNSWSAVLLIPAIVVIAATQSRKAFVMLVGGALVIAVTKSLQHKNRTKAVFRLLATVILAVVILRFLLRLPIFGGVLDRMENLIEGFTGKGEGGASSAIRAEMRKLGMKLFSKYPLVGVGMNNPRYFAGVHLRVETYLHNNYVELLAGGGIIGFLLYYSAHIYILVNLLKYRNVDKNSFLVGIVWLGIILVMDYGIVSYSEKNSMFYMMFHFLNVECLKRKTGRIQNECQKNV